MNELGKLLASLMPKEVQPRCPKCGGRLTVSATIYATVPVTATVWHDGQTRVDASNQIIETKAKLREYVEAHIDERDEIYCERYDVRGGCDFWTRPVDLEIEIGNAARRA